MSNRAAAIYSADSIGKAYGDRHVLRSASMWGWPGAITVLLGRNGSGKSTLMRIGAGVLRADHGVVHFAGSCFTRPALHTLARAGLYFQGDRAALPLRKTLRYHLENVQRTVGKTAYRTAADLLATGSLLDMRMLELSGGELRRAEITAAITCAPVCLIADEPFAGISPIDAERITSALLHLRAQGCAIIVSGHEVSGLLGIADEVVWVTAGTTHAMGSPRAAAQHHQFVTEYLGPSAAGYSVA